MSASWCIAVDFTSLQRYTYGRRSCNWRLSCPWIRCGSYLDMATSACVREKLLLATFLFMNSVHGHQCLCMREAAVGYSQWSADPCRSCEKCLSYCAIPRLLGRVVASFLHAVPDTPSLILAVMPASMIHEFKQQCFWKFFKTEYDEANNESCW